MVVVAFVRGDEYAAKAATRAAIDCDADPMYMVFAEAWATGLAIGSSSTEEARRLLRRGRRAMARTSARRARPVTLGCLRARARRAGGTPEPWDGRAHRGLRQRQEALGNREIVQTIDAFTASHAVPPRDRVTWRDSRLPSRSVTGRFFTPACGRREEGARCARTAGEDRSTSAATADDRAAVEFELAKLAKHDAAERRRPSPPPDRAAAPCRCSRCLAVSPRAGDARRARLRRIEDYTTIGDTQAARSSPGRASPAPRPVVGTEDRLNPVRGVPGARADLGGSRRRHTRSAAECLAAPPRGFPRLPGEHDHLGRHLRLAPPSDGWSGAHGDRPSPSSARSRIRSGHRGPGLHARVRSHRPPAVRGRRELGAHRRRRRR